MDNFSNSQRVSKVVVQSNKGVVAAQHRRAAEVGAAILEKGGDAVDAAIATSFALGVLEPWMSGMAAGGCMVLWRNDQKQATTINFGMRSPKEIDIKNFPLSGKGKSSDLFPWPHVIDDRNVQGATAVAIPGVIAGMDLAHQKFGKLAWADLINPAAKLANDGLLVDWYSTLLTASNASALAKDPDAASLFLDDGKWPISGAWTALSERHLDQKILSRTLEKIAAGGAQVFYKGDVGRDLVNDIRAKGGYLSTDDLASYQAEFVDPIVIPYRGGEIFAVAGLTGGPTFEKALRDLGQNFKMRGLRPDSEAYKHYALALQSAFSQRLESMGDHEAPHAPGCTTHFSVVDRHGNMCSVTQTLLSIFGSRVVSPSTGILLNNGMMWFDPEPGKPNSLGSNKRCLANYCPVIGKTAKNKYFAIGASGGRKILGSVMQLSSFMMDYDFNLEQAFHQPRIDVSGGDQVVLDSNLEQDILDEMQSTMSTTLARRNVFPYSFACPAGVMRDTTGMNSGCTEIMSPWGDAVLER
ncbi:MAG: gamma-glutamyltransferase [Betaproteobacteria bacterium]